MHHWNWNIYIATSMAVCIYVLQLAIYFYCLEVAAGIVLSETRNEKFSKDKISNNCPR